MDEGIDEPVAPPSELFKIDSEKADTSVRLDIVNPG
jgi:hypothetical protein